MTSPQKEWVEINCLAGGMSPAGSNDTLSFGSQKLEGIDKDLLEKWQGVPHKIGKRILIEFPAVSFFRSGEIDLTREGVASLKKFVNLYVPYAGQHKLIVRAFTDHRTVRPTARTYSRQSRTFCASLCLSYAPPFAVWGSAQSHAGWRLR